LTNSVLKRSSNGIKEAFLQANLEKDENILLLVDQFEELFRYRRSKEDPESVNESEAFVKLLVEAVGQNEVPVYVVITMRSDFIGECSQYQEFTEQINKSNYLIPQMTREDFREAIEGPVAVGGGKIEPHLVQLLLNEVGDNPDQLPILQHALMRTWEYWMKFEDPEKPLSIADYESVGKMDRALSEHANEAFEELNEKDKLVCSSMFKTLTEKGTDNRGIRHPTRISVVSSIAEANSDSVIRIADTFRKAGRSFLTPSAEKPIDKDSVVDLSHESLMRIWDRLKIWAEEEAQAVQMYSRLSESSTLFQEGKTGLWRPPDLQLAINWRDQQQPNLTWAGRYNPAFERTMVYLETSEKEFILEEENKVKQQKRALRRTRIFALVLGSASIVSLGFMLYAFLQKTEADRQRRTAEQQTEIANEETVRADSNFQVAQERERFAIQKQAEALEAKDTAEFQRLLAQQNAELAMQQERLAKENEREAIAQTERAISNEREANQQRERAEENATEAYQRRLLSIAQSMSVKSLQVNNDENLKALLAYQAYQFNVQYGGKEHHNDIYSGLYESLRAIRGDTFNVLRGHNREVNAVVFDPEEDLFYSGGSDGLVMKYRREGDQYQNQTILNTGIINRVLAISPDGKWLACGTDGKGLIVYDLENNNVVLKDLLVHSGRIRALTFVPGKQELISAGIDNEVNLWSLQGGTKSSIYSSGSLVQHLVASVDGQVISGATKGGEILLWLYNDWGNPTIIDPDGDNAITVTALHPELNLLASGDEYGNIVVWNPLTGNEVVALTGHDARVTGLTFSPDGLILASSSLDLSVQMYETSNWNTPPIQTRDHQGFVYNLSFSPDGSSLVSCGRGDKKILVRPTRTELMAEGICGLIGRNLTQDEWDIYVGEDIEYEHTCTSITNK
jgi:WD40 repeat protein